MKRPRRRRPIRVDLFNQIAAARPIYVAERLESRLLLSGYFDSVADSVSGPNGMMVKVTTALRGLGSVADKLPLVNKSARDISQLTDALESFRPALDAKLRALTPTTAASVVQSTLFSALNPLGVLSDKNGDSAVTAADIFVTNLSATRVDISMDLAITASFNSQVGLGLDAVPFKSAAGSNGGFSIGLTYRNFNFGYLSGAPYFSTAAVDELQFKIEGSLPSAAITAALGFINLTGQDGTPNVPDLSVRLTADLTSTGAIANPRLDGDLHLLLKLSADTPLSGLPRFRTELKLDWNFPTVSLLSGRVGTFGVPALVLQNTQLNLGSVIGGVLQPIAARVQEVIEPLQPVLDLIDKRLPIISDVSEEFGGSELSLTTLNTFLAPLGALPTAVVDAINMANRLRSFSNAVNAVAGEGGAGWLDLGSFPISGPGGASLLATAAAATGNPALTKWSSLVAAGAGASFQDLKNQIIVLLGANTGGLVNDLFSALGSSANGGGGSGGGAVDAAVNFDVPLIKNPTAVALGMLLGQDNDLITLHAKLAINVNGTVNLSPVPGLIVKLIAQANIIAVADLGYDTRGLREAIAPVFGGSSFDPSKLLRGLWIGSGTGIDASGSVGLGAGVGIADLAELTVDGKMDLNVKLGLSNPLNLTKLRPLNGDLGSQLFFASGTIDAHALVHVGVGFDTPAGFIGYRHDWPFGSANVFKFNTTTIPLPADLQPTSAYVIHLAYYDPGTQRLFLAVGSDAYRRADPALVAVTNEKFTVTRSTTRRFGIDSPNDSITVSAFGLQETFAGVRQVIAAGGSGDDTITVNDTGGLTSYVLSGDDNNDQLIINGGVNATLNGGAGDDTLDAGFGYQSLFLHGGPGFNKIILGKGKLSQLAPTVDDIQIYPGTATYLDLDDSDSTVNTTYATLSIAGSNQYILTITPSGSSAKQIKFTTGTILTLRGGKGSDTFRGIGPVSSRYFGGEGDDTFAPDYFSPHLLPDVQFAISFYGGPGNDHATFDTTGDSVGGMKLTYGVVRWGYNYYSGIAPFGVEDLQIKAASTATCTLDVWNAQPFTLSSGSLDINADRFSGPSLITSLVGVKNINYIDLVSDPKVAVFGVDGLGAYVKSAAGSGTKLRYSADASLAGLNFYGQQLDIDPAVADLARDTKVYFGPSSTSTHIYVTPSDATARRYVIGSHTLTTGRLTVDTFSSEFNVQGASGADTIEVQGLDANMSAIVHGGAGNDTIKIGDDFFNYGVKGKVGFAGDDGTDVTYISDRSATEASSYAITSTSITNPAGGVATSLDGSTENLSFNGAYSYQNYFNISGHARTPWTIIGGPAGSTFTLTSFGNYASEMTLDSGGGPSAIVLAAYAVPSVAAAVIYGDRITLGPGIVRYTGIANMDYIGAGTNPGGASGVPSNVLAVVGVPSGLTLDIDGAPQAVDTVLIGSADGATGTLSNILGIVNINLYGQPTGTFDTVWFTDTSDTANRVFQTAANSLTRSGVKVATFNGMERVVLHAGAGNDTITLNTGTNWQNAEIYGGGGSNIVNYGFGDTRNVAVNTTVDGTGGSLQLRYNNNAMPAGNETIDIRSGQITHNFQPNGGSNAAVSNIAYTNVYFISIACSSPNTTFNLRSTSAGSQYSLSGGGNTDSLNVGDGNSTAGIISPVSFLGDGVNDVVAVYSQARTTPINVHINGTSVGAAVGDNLFGPGGALSVNGYSNLAVYLGSASDHAYVVPVTIGTIGVDGMGASGTGASGDTLTLAFANVQGAALSAGSNPAAGFGSYTFTSGHKSVGFNSFEQITTDAIAPLSTSGVYDFNAATPGTAMQFSENVTPPPSSAFTVLSRTTGVTLASTAFAVTYDSATRTARLTFASGILPDGRYRVTVNAGAVSDLAGNPTSATATAYEFFVLAGDANRDGMVNFDDLVILAQNYNKSGKTFATGNFNYSSDGRVDFDDLIILAQRYNFVLPAALAGDASAGDARSELRKNRPGAIALLA